MGFIFDAMKQSGELEPKPEGGSAPAEGNSGAAPFDTATESPNPDQWKGSAGTEPSEELSEVVGSIGVAHDHDANINVDDRLVAVKEPQGMMAEEYRAIRTGMLARWQQKRHLMHTITSATPQEGKTLTSLNLGLSFAELRNRSTIVVEADLRLPQFQKLLKLDDSPGLVGLLEGDADLKEATLRVEGTGLDVIPAGRRANDRAVQLLSSNDMANLLRLLRKKYDHVIVDTPPVVELADAGILGALSDEVVLIARMNRTPRPLIEQAIRVLASYNAPVAGIIGTDHRQLRRRQLYRYGYGRSYSYYKHYKRAA